MTESIEGGVISGLGLNVQPYYKLGLTKDKEVSKDKESLVLLDIQYLGNQEVDVFMDKLKNPKVNSLFISKDSNIHKVICKDEMMSNSSKNSKRSFNNEDCVKKYMKRYQSDDLVTYYDDYDSIIESLVSREVFAGSVTKIRRLPVISLYTNKEPMMFIEALADLKGDTVTDTNKTNFIVYSESFSATSPKMYMIAENNRLKYVTSFIIDPSSKKIRSVTKKEVLEDYKSNKGSDMIINGCDLKKILEESLKTKI